MSSPRSSSEPGAPTPLHADAGRRRGDAVAIAGDYQHRALLAGPAVQRYWHQSKLELIDWLFEPRAGERVLDVGCGSGVFAHQLASYGADVLGVDANPEAVEYARRTFAREGLAFRGGLVDELELPAASFDRATCIEVIEHVHADQVRALFAELRRALRPGGRLLVTTPNYRGVWPLVEWLADRVAPTAHMDRSQHVTRFSRRSLRSALEAAGFAVERLATYSTFAPFVAALSWRAARAVDRLERAANLPFGNLLVAVARRPEPSVEAP